MTFLLSLGVRNLRRNLRRTIISAIAVIAGVAVLILGSGLIDGLDEGVIRGQIDTQVGHVSLFPPDHPTTGMENPVDGLVALPDSVAGELEGLTSTPRLRFDTRAVNGPNGMRVVGVGYEPETDAEVFSRDGFGLEGQWPEDSGAPGVVIGTGLAQILEVEIGGFVTLQTRTSMGAQNALSFPVTGVLNANNPLLDARVVFLPIDDAQRLVVAPGPSQVAIRLSRRSEALPLAERISGEWQAVTYLEGAEDMLAINRIRRAALKVMVIVLMAIAATGIANTVIMSVYERVREVGTLAAMGMRPGDIRKLFLLEGAVMGLAASIVGAIVGGSLNYRLATAGFSIGNLPEAGSSIPISNIIYTNFSWGPIWLGVLFGITVASVASVWPARFAANLDPATAVRDDG